MIKVGKRANLIIKRFTQNGAYLSQKSIESEGMSQKNFIDSVDGEHQGVLLPNRYLKELEESSGRELDINDCVDVFIYTDSEDRIVATSETPKSEVGEIAILEVVSVEENGCFLDVGLDRKSVV